MDEPVAQPILSAAERKHRAKRFNEGVKLAATFFNATAILTLGTAFISPLVQHPADVLTNKGWAFLLAALLLHMIGQIALRLYLRAEESCEPRSNGMPQTYALPILMIAVAMSALGLGGLFVTARIYDRNTRRLDARRSD